MMMEADHQEDIPGGAFNEPDLSDEVESEGSSEDEAPDCVTH
jgi:hypothetical protein